MRRCWQTTVWICAGGVSAFCVGAMLPTRSGWSPGPTAMHGGGSGIVHVEGVGADPSPSERCSLPYYSRSGLADLFGKPAPPAPEKAHVQPAAKPNPPPDPAPDPLADFVYTGMVTVNGTRYALIEHAKTKVGYYVKVGDALAGGQVASVERNTMTVSLAGAARTLALNDKFSLLPPAKNPPSGTPLADAVSTANVQTLALSPDSAAWQATYSTATGFVAGSTVFQIDGARFDRTVSGTVMLRYLNATQPTDAEVNNAFEKRN